MKKFLASLLAAGLLFGASIGSQALTFTMIVNSPGNSPGFTDWSIPLGIPTSNGSFSNLLTPVGIPTTYSSPTVVKFGDNTTFDLRIPPGGVGSGNFAGAAADFNFMIDLGPFIGPGAHNLNVYGNIAGPVGYNASPSPFPPAPFSNAHWTVTSIHDLTTGINYSGVVPNPNNGLSSVLASIMFGSVPMQIYINQVQDIPAPLLQPLSISGYVTTVPEPGTLALLIGSGVSGSLLLLRRRRA